MYICPNCKKPALASTSRLELPNDSMFDEVSMQTFSNEDYEKVLNLNYFLRLFGQVVDIIASAAPSKPISRTVISVIPAATKTITK